MAKVRVEDPVGGALKVESRLDQEAWKPIEGNVLTLDQIKPGDHVLTIHGVDALGADSGQLQCNFAVLPIDMPMAPEESPVYTPAQAEAPVTTAQPTTTPNATVEPTPNLAVLEESKVAARKAQQMVDSYRGPKSQGENKTDFFEIKQHDLYKKARAAMIEGDKTDAKDPTLAASRYRRAQDLFEQLYHWLRKQDGVE